jgi:hypothetical protein
MTRNAALSLARIATLLERRGSSQSRLEPGRYNSANDAADLAALARKLHRISERKCCEDVGESLDAREARAEAKAREIAARYNLRTYFQGDPRGCPLYLIPEEVVPVAERLGEYAYDCDGPTPDPTNTEMRKKLQARWIDSNYNSKGIAVC